MLLLPQYYQTNPNSSALTLNPPFPAKDLPQSKPKQIFDSTATEYLTECLHLGKANRGSLTFIRSWILVVFVVCDAMAMTVDRQVGHFENQVIGLRYIV